MKKLLLTSVAISALTFAGAALAQDRTGGAPGAEAPTHHTSEPGASGAAPGHAPAGERGHSAAAPGHKPAGEHGRSAEAPGHVSGRAAEKGHAAEKGRATAGETKGAGHGGPGAGAAAEHSAHSGTATGKASERSGAAEQHGHADKGASAAGSAEHGKMEQSKTEHGKVEHGKTERTGAAENGHKGAAAETGTQGAAHGHAAGANTETGKTSAEKGKTSAEKGNLSNGAAATSGATAGSTTSAGRKGETAGAADRNSAKGGKGESATATNDTRTNVSVSGNLHVDRDKAERVHSQLIESAHGEARTDVNIHVDVGRVLPERVRPRPLPSTIVEIAPEFRGYDYVVVRDEIVIVQPRTRKVVEVIRGREGGHHGEARKFSLDQRQRETVRHDVITKKVETRHIEVREGMEVPRSITLEPLPEDVYAVVPDFREYRYFVTDHDDVVIVDPQTREVVDVLD